MKNITAKQIDALRNEVNQMMDDISTGKSTRDMIAQLYANGLENKTMEQGFAIADEVIGSVRTFDEDLEEIIIDADGYIDAFVERAEQGKNTAECCNFWMRYIASLGAASCNASSKAEDKVDEKHIFAVAEATPISEGEANPEMLNRLRSEAKEVIKNSNILGADLAQEAEDIDELTDENDTLILDVGSEYVDYRALLSALLYTKIQSGEITGFPEDLTVHQVTVLCCASVEKANVMAKEGGADAKEVIGHVLNVAARVVISALGIIAVIAITALPAIMAGAFAYGFFYESILLIPVMIINILMYLLGVSKLIELWVKASDKVVKAIKTAVKTIVKGLIITGGLIFHGIKSLFVRFCRFVVDHSQPLDQENMSEEVVQTDAAQA